MSIKDRLLLTIVIGGLLAVSGCMFMMTSMVQL